MSEFYCFDKRTGRSYLVEMEKSKAEALIHGQCCLGGLFSLSWESPKIDKLNEKGFFNLIQDTRLEIAERIEVCERTINFDKKAKLDGIKSWVRVMKIIYSLFESHYKEKESKNDE